MLLQLLVELFATLMSEI
ncbi:hypothetical protein PLEIONE_14 [Mycobacterium phage Pleione]|uniref:Uncharacterized protein n=12 Tax=Bixzunavirus TaxID=680114 RepID=A0A0N9EL50_9CAUD|nr:hypothetical protein M181_gp015 [Mycobacterium phage Gizmo]YP_009017788.1 hypothetical protein PLEIONE_14 [Mycobacterium phage Pleione]YP_009216276.1 hypothetical protein ALICE_11 [Mycobacterium phage Alice]YP_009221143.1 hypothetical protein AWH68_gp013 [Mycobacterium phage Breeniome]YP_010057422.1 hypothetical protein KHO60_gp014 [Mycobacterium phage CharlieB]AEJ94998.1 hypothetical protein GHOST_13 [Mycobacterium phage Ghost]AFL46709.1 hypothetical protein AVA3_14 [Mycobacterium phage A